MNNVEPQPRDNTSPMQEFVDAVAVALGTGVCITTSSGEVVASAGRGAPPGGEPYTPADTDLSAQITHGGRDLGQLVAINPQQGTGAAQVEAYAVAARFLPGLGGEVPPGRSSHTAIQDITTYGPLLKEITGNFPGIIGIMGPPPDFRLILANRRFVDLLPDPYASGAPVLGKALRELVTEWTLETRSFVDLMTRVYETGQAVTFEQYEAERPGQGKTYWNWTIVPVNSPDPAQADLGCIMLIAYDITEAVRSRENAQIIADLVHSRAEELDAVITQMAEGVAIFGPSGEIKRMNPAAEHLLGRGVVSGTLPNKQAELYGLLTPEGELYATENLPISRALQGETVVGEQMVVRRAQDEEIYIRASVAPIKDARGAITGAVGVFHDVTQETLIDRLKSEFVSIVSHELRTPLTAIMGYSDLMLRGVHGTLSDRQAKALNAVRANADRLLHLINDLLDVSKLESGKVQLDLAPVDLASVVSRTLAQTRVLAAEAGITLENYIPRRTLPKVMADEPKLQQVVENLLTNAIKFTPAGGAVTFEARASALPADDTDHLSLNEDPANAEGLPLCSVVVSVTDTGSGLESEQLDRIWDRFYQVDATSRRRSGGAGLGLAIVRNLVELHGGQVWAESRGPGQGSTFKFSLPLATDSALHTPPPEPRPTPHRTALRPSTGKGIVLVAEDDADQREIICEMLELDGYEVVLAQDGEQALDLAHKVNPSAIILDVILPLVDGWEVLYRLKKDPITADTPVMVISVVDQPGFGKRLGADEYLLKPLEPHSLRRTVYRLVHSGAPQDSEE